MQQRFDLLTAKRRAEILTPQEYEELLTLSDEIELWDAKHVEYLAKLAQLRNIPLRLLMQQLDIRPRAHTRSRMTAEQRRRVIERAQGCCEYCLCQVSCSI